MDWYYFTIAGLISASLGTMVSISGWRGAGMALSLIGLLLTLVGVGVSLS